MPTLDFVDVSRYQKNVPWNLFRDAGVKGAMARVSEGYFLPPDYTGHIDAYFAINWQALENFDLRGATHYIRFDKNKTGGLTPVDQVNLAIDTVEAQPSKRRDADILALDVEQKATQIAHISLQARADMLAAAFEEAEKRWDKEYIWNYTGSWWWDYQMPAPHIDPMPYILSFHCWAAYYGLRSLKSKVPNGWTLEQVIAHQYSATKKIAGITVDHNDFLFDWDKYLKIEPPSPPPPPIPELPAPTPAPTPVPPNEPPMPIPVPPTPPDPTPSPIPTPKGCLTSLIDSLLRRNG